MISLSGAVSLIMQLVIAGLVFWLLMWLIDYVAPPEPFAKIARVVLAVLALAVSMAVDFVWRQGADLQTMTLFRVGDHVWARRNVDTDPELGIVKAVDYPSYMITPDDGGAEFECLQHWVRNHWEQPH